MVDEEVSVETTGMPTEECGKCGSVKPSELIRGFFPMMRSRPSQSIARTKEYFGTRRQADKYVLVSQVLYRAIQDYGVRGGTYRPVLPNPSRA